MYHNNTPQSVLDAPVSNPVYIYTNTGSNRWERRHVVNPRTGKVITPPRAVRQHATNVPYTNE